MPRTASAPKTTIPTLLAVCGTLLSSQALAQTLNWANTLGGAASISGNWSPAAVPNSANALVWNLNNTYTTTFNNFTTSSLNHTFRRGTVSLNMTSPHSTGNIVVGDLAAENAQARLVGGLYNTAGIITVGNASTSIGTLEIIGSGSVLTQSGTGDTNIGVGGNGNLEIFNGGTLNVADQFLAGSNASSTSTITMLGRDTDGQRATLNVSGTGDSRIGAGGDVTMLLDAGGVANFAGNVIVANGSASTSSITLQSPNNVVTSLNITGDLSLGRNTSTAAAGNGTLTAGRVSRATIQGTLNIGNDPDGGTGLLRLGDGNGAGDVEAHTVILGSSGTIEYMASTLTVDGGSLITPAGFQLNLSPSAGGTLASLRFINGATHNATNTTFIANAPDSNAVLRINAGAVFTQATGSMIIGAQAGSSGTVLIGGGTLNTAGLLRAGQSGSAQLNLTNAAQVTCRDLDIAASAGSIGNTIVNGSTITVTEDLVVGGSSNGSGGFNIGGSGFLTISNGGTVNTSANRIASVTSTGRLTVDHSTLNASGNVLCVGTLSLINGTINSPFIECYNTCSGSGTINARFFSDSAFTLEGPLTIGNTATNSVDRILMNVGPHTLTCIDPDVAVLADTTIAGGVINATNGLRLFGGDILSGFGTINSDFDNLGTVTSNTTAGITFTGNVVSTSGQLGGTRIHFASGSTYTGRNVSAGTKWHSDAGSTLTFTAGTSSIGDSSTDAVAFAGNLDIQGSLFLNDTGGFAMPPNTTIRGDGFTSIQGTTTLNRTGSNRHILRGTGTITAVFNSSGTISPGLDEADRTGTLTMGAFYSQSVAGDTGELIMDLDGTTTLLHDTLVLNGGGAVDGVLRLRVGYSPLNGHRIPIVTRGGNNTILTGIFDQLIAPVGWSLDYRADSIDAVYCASDFNADGISDFFDYLDFVADFSSGDARADFNVDGVIDFFDYLDFVAAFSSGC
ncbi:MAG: hypothetical protein KGS45_02170 [Planctomycetes bacterium]|nr:hypothetical protein [Planctomycetota bacterium]